jgi:hypothetical protein
MDRRAPVDEKTPSTKTGFVEQAIFTSIRSPMGQGYQVVAASPGISGDEKKEIVQCAPSHGSLCDPSPTAVGLASFTLRSGRRCVFLSRSAGVEPTARGGYRIHTHVLVMEPARFREFECDPLRVEAAARPLIHHDAASGTETRRYSPGASARLDPLFLAHRTGGPPDTMARPPVNDANRALRVLSAVLDGQRLLVVGAPEPQEVLRRVLGATPTAVRERLSLSCGLKFSPTRGFQLVLADADPREMQRIVRDQDVALLQWAAAPDAAGSSFDAWLRFVRQHWESGRHRELNRLAGELTTEDAAEALERIALLCADIERIKQADALLLDQLLQRYSHVTPASPAHKRLLSELQEAARVRKEELKPAEEEIPSDGEVEVIGLA